MYDLKETLRSSEPIPAILRKLIDEKEGEVDDEEEGEKEEETGKTQEEMIDEKQMEKLKMILGTFSQNSQLEQMRKTEEIEKMKMAGEVEGNQAKGFLTTKINEINKEINEKISLCTRTVINPVNETLSEKERAKKSK